LSGGAPFTKDIVYLDGLLRVHDFLRSVVAAGRADVLMLLFCGKLDLDDIPVLCELAELGLLKPPKFLPPWAADRRFLVSYLAYSGFLGRVRMGQVHGAVFGGFGTGAGGSVFLIGAGSGLVFRLPRPSTRGG
jgi:hypothetical protein